MSRTLWKVVNMRFMLNAFSAQGFLDHLCFEFVKAHWQTEKLDKVSLSQEYEHHIFARVKYSYHGRLWSQNRESSVFILSSVFVIILLMACAVPQCHI